MKMFWWLLTLTLLAKSVRTFPTNSLFVSEDAIQCNDKGTILFCDYKNNPQDPVYTKPLKSQDIAKVFIFNAKELHISDKFCANVAVHNVGKATVNQTAECNKEFTLVAAKTTFDYVHSRAKEIQLSECKVGTIVTDMTLTKLNIIQSEIDVLNAMAPLKYGAAAIIQDSQVTTIEKLVIDSGSSLVIERCKIYDIQTEGLEIINSSVTVKETYIGKFTQGTLILEDFQGGVTITRTMHKTGSRQQNVSECTVNNIYSILFYITLALLILSWIGFLIFSNNNVIKQKLRYFISPKKTRGQKGEHSEEENMPLDSQAEAELIRDILKESQLMLANFTKNKPEPKADTTASQVGPKKRHHDSPESFIPKIGYEEYVSESTGKLDYELCMLDTKVTYLKNISGQEGRVLQLSRETKLLKASNLYPRVTEFYEGINNILGSPVSDASITTEAFTKSDEKFKEIVQLMGSPVEKNHLLAKLKEMEQDNNSNKDKKSNKRSTLKYRFSWKKDNSGPKKNNDDPDSKLELGRDVAAELGRDVAAELGRPSESKNITQTRETSTYSNTKTDMNKSNTQSYEASKERAKEFQEYEDSYFILDANKFTSTHKAITDIQKQCLSQYLMLLNQYIHYVEKFVQLLLQINIYYAQFFLEKSKT